MQGEGHRPLVLLAGLVAGLASVMCLLVVGPGATGHQGRGFGPGVVEVPQGQAWGMVLREHRRLLTWRGLGALVLVGPVVGVTEALMGWRV